MFNSLLIVIGKLVRWTSQLLNLGHGSTWPGHIALETNKDFIKETLAKNPHLKVILIAGTNGKTTTGKMIKTILEKDGKRVFHNEAGANLLNGIASTLIQYCNKVGKVAYDYAILEVDENTLPLAIDQITPQFVILLNLFRDQLDRYGEVDMIANKWKNSLQNLNEKTKVILNADDSMIAYIGRDLKNEVLYFGLSTNKSKKILQHAVDTIHCPNCGSKLTFSQVFLSHLGDWVCKNCKFSRPKLALSNFSFYPLPGLYNRYNTLASVILAKMLKVPSNRIMEALLSFQPAFGRQEKIEVGGKIVQIFLSKNPASFNESLRTIQELGAKHVLFVLNDRIPDGRDVSWIWDVDIEELLDSFQNIIVSGDRVYDMALRLKYANSSKIKNDVLPAPSGGVSLGYPKKDVFSASIPISSGSIHPRLNRGFLEASNKQSLGSKDPEKLKIKNSLKIENLKFQIWEDLQNAITQGLKQTPKAQTLYILPTYSAMLEVRKILTGKRIL